MLDPLSQASLSNVPYCYFSNITKVTPLISHLGFVAVISTRYHTSHRHRCQNIGSILKISQDIFFLITVLAIRVFQFVDTASNPYRIDDLFKPIYQDSEGQN